VAVPPVVPPARGRGRRRHRGRRGFRGPRCGVHDGPVFRQPPPPPPPLR
jgi:hypothetical protein